jgi:cytokinin dehydrogenase
MNSAKAAVAISHLQRIGSLQLDTSESAVAKAATDFGGLSRGSALAVVRPANMGCLPEIVRIARAHGLKLTIRGKGLSQSGQAVADQSVLIDLSRCDSIGTLDMTKQTIVCEAGATWRSVLAKAAPVGLGPKVLPLNLDLSVGGTLSAGGFGSTSHTHGVAVSHVTNAEVVLGSGQVVRCGPSQQRPIFDAVLGGVGRCGVIMHAELQLAPVKPKVRTLFLLYESLDALLVDQHRIASDGRATHLEAFCSASVQGLRRVAGGSRQPLVHWLFGLHLGVGYDSEPPAPDAILNDLRYNKLLNIDDDEYVEHASRYDARFEMMRLTGAWDQIHPWFEALLPSAAASEVIAQALTLLPMFFGDGHRIFLMARPDLPAALAFPRGERVIGFTVLPTGIPNVLRESALKSLVRLDDIVRQAGGRRYPSGWLFRTDPDGWKAHYGNSYPALSEAKRECDPDSVFQSCLNGLLLRPTGDSDI